jgi:hypothetical protein
MTEGVGHTAIPEVDPLVHQWRIEYDPSAAEGVPDPEASGGVAEEPPVDGPAVDPVAPGDVGDRDSRVEGLSHGQVALLNHRKLHKHRILPGSVERK